MDAAEFDRALRMLKALAESIVEALEYDGNAIDPTEVATRTLLGYRRAPEDATQRASLHRELESFVRQLRSSSPPTGKGG